MTTFTITFKTGETKTKEFSNIFEAKGWASSYCFSFGYEVESIKVLIETDDTEVVFYETVSIEVTNNIEVITCEAA